LIEVSMPAGKSFRFEHAVFDYNGTLAVDGVLSDEVRAKLALLSEQVHTVVLTADTFGSARNQLADLSKVEMVVVDAVEGGCHKAEYVKQLGQYVVVVGNGVNDRLMFELGLSICVIGREGASGKTLACADIVVVRPEDALDLLLSKKRMVATLRE
jgi:soluble P-type ATPase